MPWRVLGLVILQPSGSGNATTHDVHATMPLGWFLGFWLPLTGWFFSGSQDILCNSDSRDGDCLAAKNCFILGCCHNMLFFLDNGMAFGKNHPQQCYHGGHSVESLTLSSGFWGSRSSQGNGSRRSVWTEFELLLDHGVTYGVYTLHSW